MVPIKTPNVSLPPTETPFSRKKTPAPHPPTISIDGIPIETPNVSLPPTETLFVRKTPIPIPQQYQLMAAWEYVVLLFLNKCIEIRPICNKHSYIVLECATKYWKILYKIVGVL